MKHYYMEDNKLELSKLYQLGKTFQYNNKWNNSTRHGTLKRLIHIKQCLNVHLSIISVLSSPTTQLSQIQESNKVTFVTFIHFEIERNLQFDQFIRIFKWQAQMFQLVYSHIPTCIYNKTFPKHQAIKKIPDILPHWKATLVYTPSNHVFQTGTCRTKKAN